MNFLLPILVMHDSGIQHSTSMLKTLDAVPYSTQEEET
jgi:hypothetical protein